MSGDQSAAALCSIAPGIELPGPVPRGIESLSRRCRFHACTSGIPSRQPTRQFKQLALRGAHASSAAVAGLSWHEGRTSGWRGVELSDLTFAGNLDATSRSARANRSVCEGCPLWTTDGKSQRTLRSICKASIARPWKRQNLIAENIRAEVTAGRPSRAQSRAAPTSTCCRQGDLIVLASDTRRCRRPLDRTSRPPGAAWSIRSQAEDPPRAPPRSSSTARRSLPLIAGRRPRSASSAGSVPPWSTASAPAPPAGRVHLWLRADDHCRVFAAHTRCRLTRSELVPGARAAICAT